MHGSSLAWSTRILAPISFAAALGLAGCVSAATGEDFDLGASAPVGPHASEILRLRTRDVDVAILAGDGARRVVIYDAHDARARSSDIDRLRATAPALFDLFTTGLASDAARRYLDATYSPPSGFVNDSHEAEDARAR